MELRSAAAEDALEQHELDAISKAVRISKQTLVRWTDRGLLDAELGWGISDADEELRLINITPRSLTFLREFAEEYRDETVSRTEARRLLKVIHRGEVQKLLRHGDLASRTEDGETRVVVGSVEDYLLASEAD